MSKYLKMQGISCVDYDQKGPESDLDQVHGSRFSKTLMWRRCSAESTESKREREREREGVEHSERKERVGNDHIILGN